MIASKMMATKDCHLGLISAERS